MKGCTNPYTKLATLYIQVTYNSPCSQMDREKRGKIGDDYYTLKYWSVLFLTLSSTLQQVILEFWFDFM